MTVTKAQALRHLTKESGRVPCSRYGWDSESCAPVAWAAFVILRAETGEGDTLEALDNVMGLVVNDHDDVDYLIRNYGREYGFEPEDYLEDDEPATPHIRDDETRAEFVQRSAAFYNRSTD